MILKNAFYTVSRLTFGKSVQDCTSSSSQKSLRSQQNFNEKSFPPNPEAAFSFFFFSLGLTRWSCPKCYPLGGAEAMPPRRQTGLTSWPVKNEKHCCLGPFVQCCLSLPQKPFPTCELGNIRYCCPGSLQMSSPLLG